MNRIDIDNVTFLQKQSILSSMVLQNSGRLTSDSNEPKTDVRLLETQNVEAIDSKYGFERINSDFGREEVGYLINMHATEVVDEDKRLLAAVDYYFIKEDGKRYGKSQNQENLRKLHSLFFKINSGSRCSCRFYPTYTSNVNRTN